MTAPPAFPSVQVPPSGSSRSSVSLASGHLNQARHKTKITGHHTTVRKDLTISSWAEEIPNAVGPVQYAPARSASQRTPLVRVTVNGAPRYHSRPIVYRQAPPSMAMPNGPYPGVNVHPQRPVSAPPMSMAPPTKNSNSSRLSSLSASPSMFIPKDAIHGRATQVEIFASPYYAPHNNRAGSLRGADTHRTRAAHPGLQTGRYMPTQQFPSAFPAFPAFSAFPAFPAFPPFPSFPPVSGIYAFRSESPPPPE
jgi:hypothetical protein